MQGECDINLDRRWCGISASNVISGKRKRRQAENIYLDERWTDGLRSMLLADVGDEEEHAAVLDESLDEAEVCSESKSGESSEDGSDFDDMSQSSEEDPDYVLVSNDSEDVYTSSESESSHSEGTESEFEDEASSEEESESESDRTVDEEDDGYLADLEDRGECLFRWFSGLVISAREWDDFAANLDTTRWQTRPRDLDDTQFYSTWVSR